MKNILVTGGCGYIGSHTVVELLNCGYNVIVVDNLVNSSSESLKRVEKITGKKVKFYQNDIRDFNALDKIFKKENIDAVIHFAGLKAVGESVSKPLEYYENNVGGSICLFKVMNKYNVNKIVFSSSATVYGDPKKIPITENFPLQAVNPYGATKLMIERILVDISKTNKNLEVILLRYFNPIGAHESGLIGEDPNDIPNNLVPYIAQVACGRLPKLYVYGNDYPTKDGTGVRDYIHVCDLAKGHISSLKNINKPGVYIYNLGTGNGYSVLDIIKAFSKASGKNIPYEIVGRRLGDVATSYTSSAKALKEIKWKANLDIDDMCKSHWNWQRRNPNGYKK